jgi:bifunctional DNA-binding transcriptional regulator/antitoxin component of YhaV-PrlF toxin-antitoxin module
MSQVINISLDDMGRILIPAAVQSRLGLSPGMSLVVEEGDQGSMRLRVQSEPLVLVDKGGVLVVRAEPLSDLTDVTRHERNRRVSAVSHSPDSRSAVDPA